MQVLARRTLPCAAGTAEAASPTGLSRSPALSSLLLMVGSGCSTAPLVGLGSAGSALLASSPARACGGEETLLRNGGRAHSSSVASKVTIEGGKDIRHNY